jgi:hypothetical protein
MTTTLYANPYDISYTGFYFGSTEEFNEQLSQASYEEVEIDYIVVTTQGCSKQPRSTRATSTSGSMSWTSILTIVMKHQPSATC